MSIVEVSVTLRCDWPGCGRTIDLLQNTPLYDHGWEQRGTDWHVCPGHVARTLEELQDEKGFVWKSW